MRSMTISDHTEMNFPLLFPLLSEKICLVKTGITKYQSFFSLSANKSSSGAMRFTAQVTLNNAKSI